MVGVKHYLKISAPQLSWCLEDSEQKNDNMNELMNDLMLIMCSSSCELYILCFDHLHLFKVALKKCNALQGIWANKSTYFLFTPFVDTNIHLATKPGNFDIKCHGSERPGYFKTNVGVSPNLIF